MGQETFRRVKAALAWVKGDDWEWQAAGDT